LRFFQGETATLAKSADSGAGGTATGADSHPARARSIVGVVTEGGADAVGREAAARQQVGGLAALGQVDGTGRTETPADQVAGQSGPVPLEAVQSDSDRVPGQPWVPSSARM